MPCLFNAQEITKHEFADCAPFLPGSRSQPYKAMGLPRGIPVAVRGLTNRVVQNRRAEMSTGVVSARGRQGLTEDVEIGLEP